MQGGATGGKPEYVEEEKDRSPCAAEAVGRADAQGRFQCLHQRGTCQDKRMKDPAPLLAEDARTSDTRGWTRNASGAVLAPLCRYRDSVYRNARLKYACGKPGCNRRGNAQATGGRRCIMHGPRREGPVP